VCTWEECAPSKEGGTRSWVHSSRKSARKQAKVREIKVGVKAKYRGAPRKRGAQTKEKGHKYQGTPNLA
jgi:hypothetical protein